MRHFGELGMLTRDTHVWILVGRLVHKRAFDEENNVKDVVEAYDCHGLSIREALREGYRGNWIKDVVKAEKLLMDVRYIN